MNKFFAFCLLILCPVSFLFAQQYQGYNSSNYSGVTGIYENPANIADSRFLLDLNLLSSEFNFNNNFISFNTAILSTNDNPVLDTIYNDAFQQFREDQFIQKDWTQMKQTRIFNSINVQGPTAMFSIGKHGFALYQVTLAQQL